MAAADQFVKCRQAKFVGGIFNRFRVFHNEICGKKSSFFESLLKIGNSPIAFNGKAQRHFADLPIGGPDQTRGGGKTQ